jgi:nucleoside-diphosphate-sugar epimerase
MNVLITGSSGRIGRYVVQEMVDFGHSVTAADLAPPPRHDDLHIRVDLTDAGDVYQAFARSEPDAVIHLGAWANEGLAPDTRVYGDNVLGTFNVFQACADLGIRRVVSASSAQVYGFAKAPPVYVPVDEDHPYRPANCYALSKMAGEQAADYFVERYGMTILSFRFMGVRMPAEIAPQIEEMAADPASGSWLLWTRTDARDAATACRLAVEAAEVPSGPYNITGAQVVLPTLTSELVSNHFGTATEVREPLAEHVSPLSSVRAREAFGYAPAFAWRLGQYYPDTEEQ